jgi:hypothetical protein
MLISKPRLGTGMLVTMAMILAVSQSASAATLISAATDPVADARFRAPVFVESVIATRSVDGQANIFAAGRSAVPPDTDGVLPPVVPVDGAELVTFPSVSGTFSCCGGSLANGPDGGRLQDVFDPCCATSSYRGIGGIHDYSVAAPAGGYLVGVFLDETTPAAPAPAVLDFTDAHDFAELAPGLRQVFFIGDGRDVAGDRQRFHVPSGATRLFLGFSDGCDPSGGPPSCYYDNTGGFVASVLTDGPPRFCQIVGTVGDDVIEGTPGDDVICGLPGNDVIHGRGGNDRIFGGKGNDTVYGGLGDDRIWGKTGRDSLFGQDGMDVLRGGWGRDALDGGGGTDTCNGGRDLDTATACESITGVP